jgi:hypothetical protein
MPLVGALEALNDLAAAGLNLARTSGKDGS